MFYKHRLLLQLAGHPSTDMDVAVSREVNQQVKEILPIPPLNVYRIQHIVYK